MTGKGKPKKTSNLALLYTRVSTQLQAAEGVSLDVQDRELHRAAEGAGFTEVEVQARDGLPGFRRRLRAAAR